MQCDNKHIFVFKPERVRLEIPMCAAIHPSQNTQERLSRESRAAALGRLLPGKEGE